MSSRDIGGIQMHRLVLCALALSLTAVMITDQTLLACETPQTINAIKSEQPPVMTRSGINSVLASLPSVTYKELDPEFRKRMNMTWPVFEAVSASEILRGERDRTGSTVGRTFSYSRIYNAR